MPDLVPEDLAQARPRSCPTCHSIGPPMRPPSTGRLCTDAWHGSPRPSHVFVEVPTVRPADPLAREMGDRLYAITRNYEREGSGPGSRFEGQLLEDVLAVAMMGWLAAEGLDTPFAPLPPGMNVLTTGFQGGLACKDHGVVLAFAEESLRHLAFTARRHWREQHG